MFHYVVHYCYCYYQWILVIIISMSAVASMSSAASPNFPKWIWCLALYVTSSSFRSIVFWFFHTSKAMMFVCAMFVSFLTLQLHSKLSSSMLCTFLFLCLQDESSDVFILAFLFVSPDSSAVSKLLAVWEHFNLSFAWSIFDLVSAFLR